MKDDDQGDLFDWKYGEAYARHSDPDTSQEAAEEVEGDPANKMEQEVLQALIDNPAGLTMHGIVRESGIPWNTASPRMAPLVRKNLAVDSGLRWAGPSGKSCIVWRAAIYEKKNGTQHPGE